MKINISALNLQIIALVLVFAISQSHAQFKTNNEQIGLPPIKNYNSANYPANGSNQAIVQDARGIMYIGNQEGILEFDGSNWRLIANANRSFPKALGVESFREPNSKIRIPGRIYVGGIGEFGYLSSNKQGNLNYVSLIDKVPQAFRDFQDIWAICVLEKGVIFQSFKYIFYLSKDHIQVFNSESSNSNNVFHISWSVNGDYYVRQWGVGLQKLVSGKLQLVTNGENFANERIYSILPFSGDTIIIGTRNKGMLLFDGKQYLPWKNEAEDFLQENQIYSGVNIGTDYLAFGTTLGGVVILNKRGKVYRIINKDFGLIDNLIFKLFVDQEGSLWIGQASGLSNVPLNSPFQRIDNRWGIEGQGFSAVTDGDNLWLGTVQGLYKAKWPLYPDPIYPRSTLERISTPASTMALTKLGSHILAAQNTGIISIDSQSQVENIVSDRIVFSFLHLKNHPDLILAGTINGLILLNHQSRGAQIIKTDIIGFNKSVFYMAEGKSGEIWIGDEQKGIFRLDFDESYKEIQSITLYDNQRGLPTNTRNKVFPSIDGPLFTTENGIYRYDSIADKLEPDPRFSRLSPFENFVHTLFEDSSGDIWIWAQDFEYDQMVLMKYQKKEDDYYELVQLPFRNIDEHFRSFYPNIIQLDSNRLFFAASEGFEQYLKRKGEDKVGNLEVLVRKVEIFGEVDSLIFAGTFPNPNGIGELSKSSTDQIFSYNQNSIRFSWSAITFIDPEKTSYQYLLDGQSKNWSRWSNQNFKEYSNLPPGKYKFKIRAQSSNGRESQPANFDFIIVAPWYYTWWAWGAYLIIGTCLIWGIIFVNSKRLVEVNKKLEATIENRTAEIRRQKTEIEREKAKSDELLTNILPEQIAKELKATGAAKVRYYETATVLFTDFKDFTIKTKEMSPEALIGEINYCFKEFDRIISNYSIEKIKTIGDSYMCVAGLPTESNTHASDAVSAALEILNFMLHLKLDRENEGKPYFEIRIGIHTGPVIAGIVGSMKYSYDVWGDTVNIASRMESSGKVGEVNISQATYEMVKNIGFRFEDRGKISAKNVEMNMYFVKGKIS